MSDAAGSAEDQLIGRHFRPLARHPGAFGFNDDCAAIAPPAGHDLVLKTDGLIAGVHFLPDDPADEVARKALRVNLSDLAAKGAVPLGCLLAIALPKGFSEDWLAAFARGLGADAEAYGCPLLGGDTDSTPGPLSISISAIGTLPAGTMVRRSGAKAGDKIYLTGTVGDAALGLALRQNGGRWAVDAAAAGRLSRRHALPEPRMALTEALRTCASASIDISDGLAGDFAKLCRASGVTGEIDVARLPLSPDAQQVLGLDPAAIEPIVTGGEDYEILCTVPAIKMKAFRTAASRSGVRVTEVGTITAGDAPARIWAAGRPLAFERSAYSHF